MAKVALLLSGGIDSSLALYLLRERGFEVKGFSLLFHPQSRCCSIDGLKRAEWLCKTLGVDYELLDVSVEFERLVIKPFVAGYLAGATPNPCLACNRHIKFGSFLDLMLKNGFDYIASGHYARIEENTENQGFYLKKGIDTTKDQSYMLFYLRKQFLPSILFPLGQMLKEEVIKFSRQTGIWTGEVKESQDICFVKGNLSNFFEEKGILPDKGPIINDKNQLLGYHKGLFLYTIGQREGLRISYREPLYVIAKDLEKNCLIVGRREDALKKNLLVSDLNFLNEGYKNTEMIVKARIRYGMKEKEATIKPISNDKIELIFTEPQFAPTPGQGAVFYKDDLVIGGGVIQETY
ncbi:MAG: tRNA-specific 2-thiouridylase MnmA [candidate division WS2 bacterium]|nr:tRNA-specific 2-thiouridylase MnmA [Candidatus Lithacetigena glycinireducens]